MTISQPAGHSMFCTTNKTNINMTTHTTELVKATKNPEKKHSVVFEPAAGVTDPIVTSVYLMRPMVNGHTKAKITVEFLD